jgi:hypothetical protein
VGIIWEKDGKAFSAIISDLADEVRFRLTVEEDHGRWHWTVWRPGLGMGSLQGGHAITLHGALSGAEDLMLRWNGFQARDQIGTSRGH